MGPVRAAERIGWRQLDGLEEIHVYLHNASVEALSRPYDAWF